MPRAARKTSRLRPGKRHACATARVTPSLLIAFSGAPKRQLYPFRAAFTTFIATRRTDAKS